MHHCGTQETTSPSLLERFRSAGADVDHGRALGRLIGAFRDGDIGPRSRAAEEQARATALSEHRSAWLSVFPPLPHCPFPPRTPWEQAVRGMRDRYLRRLVVAAVRELRGVPGPIVNPVAYVGTHARSIARSLPGLDVVATDIDGTWNHWYSAVWRITHGTQHNYSFLRESIFSPTHGRHPCAVVFFGACGSLTDATLDYAIAEAAPLIMGRACCHENIGNSTDLARYPTLLNYGFRLKSRVLDIYKARNRGWYFCSDYGQDAYPRSASARAVSHAAEFHDIARHALDSDVCRSIIDLDRCARLQECGYDVLYEQELFFAVSRTHPLEAP